MFRSCIAAVVLVVATSLGIDDALAHFNLLEPEARYGPDFQSDGPCGLAGGERTSNVTTFAPGATVTVTWAIMVEHDSYRISFDVDGDDDFDNGANILLDNIPSGSTTAQVTLPNTECDNCTLQVVQRGAGDYFHCADIILSNASGGDADAGPAGDADAGTDADGGSAGEGDAGTAGGTGPGGEGGRGGVQAGCAVLAPFETGGSPTPAVLVCLAIVISVRRRSAAH